MAHAPLTGNKLTAFRLISGLRTLGAEERRALLTEDAVWWDPLRGELDSDAYLAGAQQFVACLASELTMTLHSATEEDDRVALELEAIGTLTNGRVYHNRYHILFRFRDGRVASVREYLDTQHVATSRRR